MKNIKRKKAQRAYKAYSEACRGINIKENEKILLESKSYWSYNFTKYVPGADIKAHEQVILGFKDKHYSLWFAKDIPGANIEEHFKIIYNSGDKEYLEYFIQEVNYKGTKVEEWLLYV